MNPGTRRVLRALFDAELGRSRDFDPADYTPEATRMLAGHNLAGLILRRFERLLPPADRLALAAMAARGAALAAEASRLLAELHAALDGVPFLVLKGRPVAEWLYGDPELRPSDDVDIVIRSHDLERVTRRLNSLGFAGDGAGRADLEAVFRRGTGMPVDVHVRTWSDRTTPERLLAQSVEWRHAGRSFRVPPPAAQLRLLSAHFVHDLGKDLLHLLDIVLALKKLEATPQGETAAAAAAAGEWLGLELPGRASPAWGPLRWYWRRRGPEPWRGGWWMRSALSYYVQFLMNPGRLPSLAARAIWPAHAAARWRGRLGKLLG